MTEVIQAPRSQDRIARCECGALQITVTAEPRHVHACTCTKCQRSSGSALSWSAWFPEAAVTIQGAYLTYHFSDPVDPRQMTGFCATCGGGKFFRTGDYLSDCIGISAGSFAAPDFLHPDHIHWWPDRPTWMGTPDGPHVLHGN